MARDGKLEERRGGPFSEHLVEEAGLVQHRQSRKHRRLPASLQNRAISGRELAGVQSRTADTIDVFVRAHALRSAGQYQQRRDLQRRNGRQRLFVQPYVRGQCVLLGVRACSTALLHALG